MRKYIVVALLLVLGACGTQESGAPTPSIDIIPVKADVINRISKFWRCSSGSFPTTDLDFYEFRNDYKGSSHLNCKVLSQESNGFIHYDCDSKDFSWNSLDNNIDITFEDTSSTILKDVRIMLWDDEVTKQMTYLESSKLFGCIEVPTDTTNKDINSPPYDFN